MLTSIKLLNYLELSIEEKKMVLLWRNHPNIKQWMYTTQEIKLEEHLSFIEQLKNSKDLYYLVKNEEKYIGTINLTDISSKKATLGLFSNPQHSGIGKVLLQTILDYGFSTLKLDILVAEVFSNNIAALTLYKKFNFREISKKTISNREVFCMELKNEDR